MFCGWPLSIFVSGKAVSGYSKQAETGRETSKVCIKFCANDDYNREPMWDAIALHLADGAGESGSKKSEIARGTRRRLLRAGRTQYSAIVTVEPSMAAQLTQKEKP